MSTNANLAASDGFFIGEDKSLVFNITSGGSPVNITGWTIQFAMADALSGSSDLTKTATLTTPLAGICTVAIASGDTIGLNPESTWYYRLRRTDSGSRAELAYGTIDLLDVYVD
jgi:hypothetical protein